MGAKMKLGTKITLGFFSLIAITVALGGLALWSMHVVKKAGETTIPLNDDGADLKEFNG